MRTIRKYSLSVIILTLLFSCGNKKTTLADFEWLQGKWTGNTDGTDFFEEWQPKNGKMMKGFGGAVVGKDTVFSEKVSIGEREDGVYYTAIVQQNSGPVSFKFTGYKNDSIIFENPAHDFPQRIIYYRLPDGGLYACVDGKNFGKYNREEFRFSKAK
jgi:hypothetical protein